MSINLSNIKFFNARDVLNPHMRGTFNAEAEADASIRAVKQVALYARDCLWRR